MYTYQSMSPLPASFSCGVLTSQPWRAHKATSLTLAGGPLPSGHATSCSPLSQPPRHLTPFFIPLPGLFLFLSCFAQVSPWMFWVSKTLCQPRGGGQVCLSVQNLQDQQAIHLAQVHSASSLLVCCSECLLPSVIADLCVQTSRRQKGKRRKSHPAT